MAIEAEHIFLERGLIIGPDGAYYGIFLRNQIEPWLDVSVPMAAGGSRTGTLDADASGPPTPSAEATLSLVGDPVLRNYLTRFVVWSNWTHLGGRRLMDRIDLTLEVIQEAGR